LVSAIFSETEGFTETLGTGVLFSVNGSLKCRIWNSIFSE